MKSDWELFWEFFNHSTRKGSLSHGCIGWSYGNMFYIYDKPTHMLRGYRLLKIDHLSRRYPFSVENTYFEHIYSEYTAPEFDEIK